MTDKKFTPIMFIALIFLALVGFLALLFMNGSNNEPEDAGVSGFGDEATNDLFPAVVETMLNTPCTSLLHEGNLQDSRFTNISAGKYTLTVDQFSARANVPLSCFYELSADKAISFEVHTYTETSEIDNSREDLFKRVNSQKIETEVDQGRIGVIDYSFGTDKVNPEECIATIYHPLNDFEVATIEYFGFDCETEFNTNREFVSLFGNYLVFALENVYNKAGNTSTEELLTKWGYTDYISGLDFYK